MQKNTNYFEIIINANTCIQVVHCVKCIFEKNHRFKYEHHNF